MSLRIVYEDADLLVVDKPAGMVVHSAPGHEGVTLVDELRSHLVGPWTLEDSLRPGIVHRLDKDTSGLLVVAKNPEAHAGLADQMKAHSTIKRYLALVEGRMTVPEGVIDAPIGRDPRHRQRMAIVRAGGSGGREARTRFRTLQEARGALSWKCSWKPDAPTRSASISPLSTIPSWVISPMAAPSLHSLHASFCTPRIWSSPTRAAGKWLIFDSPLPPDLATFALPWLAGFSRD